MSTIEVDFAKVKGRYRHFKGGIYEVLGVGKHSETQEELMVYQHERGELWLRPLPMFYGSVTRLDGTTVNRFEKLSDETTLGKMRSGAEDCAENHYTAEEGRALEKRIKELEHQLYSEAARTVGAKRSGRALVDSVHKLMVLLKVSEGGKKVVDGASRLVVEAAARLLVLARIFKPWGGFVA